LVSDRPETSRDAPEGISFAVHPAVCFAIRSSIRWTVGSFSVRKGVTVWREPSPEISIVKPLPAASRITGICRSTSEAMVAPQAKDAMEKARAANPIRCTRPALRVFISVPPVLSGSFRLLDRESCKEGAMGLFRKKQ
jgi:hypothetical protein